jgi:hypothetical protein
MILFGISCNMMLYKNFKEIIIYLFWNERIGQNTYKRSQCEYAYTSIFINVFIHVIFVLTGL